MIVRNIDIIDISKWAETRNVTPADEWHILAM
jgi:hypothetical protein